ncbi:glutathione S-transferase family protein [Paraburkholderia sp. BR14320]|uniref:glutathione S-transferase family protein n=1 Tax=unclassified Paraburkholderia TaxID=2615204 RepID=UPI0034CE0D0C
MNAYRLYFSPGACSLAAHIVLEETGAPFELISVPVAKGANLQPGYLAVNPKGRVPALAIPGEPRVLTELPAIVTFIARRHYQTLAMLPTAPVDEARCHEWFAWLAGWVHGVGFGGLWRPARFVAEVSLHAAVSAHARQTIETAFAQIESTLTDGCSYALPCGYTIVDPFLLVLYRWGMRIGLPMGDRYQAWTASARRVVERPAVQRALHSEGISLEI